MATTANDWSQGGGGDRRNCPAVTPAGGCGGDPGRRSGRRQSAMTREEVGRCVSGATPGGAPPMSRPKGRRSGRATTCRVAASLGANMGDLLQLHNDRMGRSAMRCMHNIIMQALLPTGKYLQTDAASRYRGAGLPLRHRGQVPPQRRRSRSCDRRFRLVQGFPSARARPILTRISRRKATGRIWVCAMR